MTSKTRDTVEGGANGDELRNGASSSTSKKHSLVIVVGIRKWVGRARCSLWLVMTAPVMMLFVIVVVVVVWIPLFRIRSLDQHTGRVETWCMCVCGIQVSIQSFS